MNIVGEHIDYLGGTVLPFACSLELRVTCVPEADGGVTLTSAAGEPLEHHVAAVVRKLREAGYQTGGVRGEVTSDIPVGAGLSSSTALEVAVALAVTGGARVAPEVLRRAEQLATGVPCGLMDQTTMLRARAGHALLLDCSSGEAEHVEIPPSFGFVVVDTGTRRALADGRYAERRAEVERGHPRRRRHAETEQERVFAAAEALRGEDLAGLGEILDASHASLRDDFEVSSEALDRAVACVRAHEACAGARLVGAGFAGCVVAVVRKEAEDEAAAFVEERLPGARAIAVQAVDAAGEVS